jgi:tRNA(fMet)-specific endonuclease VapC
LLGASKSKRREANLDRIEKLRFAVLDFDREDARAAGEIRARLEIAGTPIGAYDILIAGQALSRGFILITRNVREFERVEGLKLEHW